MKRPVTIDIAVALTITSFAISGERLWSMREALQYYGTWGSVMKVYWISFATCVLPALAVLIFASDVARSFLAVLMVIAFAMMAYFGIGLFIQAMDFTTAIVTAMQVGGLILMYVPASNAWIKDRKQRASTNPA